MPHRSAALAVLVALAPHAVSADTVRVGGTGAAQGLMQRLAGPFAAASPGDRLEVAAGLGSTGGIAAVIDGALTLAVSARALREAEAAKGARETPWLETPFVFVTSNGQAQRLGRSQIVSIYEGTLRTWPDGHPIKPILRPRSDTSSDLLTASFEGMKDALEKTRKRPDVPVTATDQDNVQMAEQIESSFTTMTLLQFTTEKPRLRLIALDGIEPSIEHLQGGTYLLRAEMHLVVASRLSPGGERLLDFLRSPVAERVIRDSGALPLPVRSAIAR